MTAAPTRLRRLRKRSEFLAAARGRRVGRPAFALQSAARPIDVPGIGFTVTRQVGNAPERNRIRRRLREAAKACAAGLVSQHDYVLIGRREALSIPFGQLCGELAAAIVKIHQPRRDQK
jgi:ribonuclease P protein component